jgi:hypothetical protein
VKAAFGTLVVRATGVDGSPLETEVTVLKSSTGQTVASRQATLGGELTFHVAPGRYDVIVHADNDLTIPDVWIGSEIHTIKVAGGTVQPSPDNANKPPAITSVVFEQTESRVFEFAVSTVDREDDPLTVAYVYAGNSDPFAHGVTTTVSNPISTEIEIQVTDVENLEIASMTIRLE